MLADQQVVFRQSLAQILTSGGHSVVSQVGDSAALDRCMIENEPDIVMLDRYLPGEDALAYIRMLNALQPQTQILLLVAYEHEARALQSTAFLAGASGCMSKDLIASLYPAAVQQLLEHQLLFPTEVIRRTARQHDSSVQEIQLQNLTKRELEILEMVAEGMRNRAIAAQLYISYHTTMAHMHNIMSKLHVSNRTEAGILFLRSRDRLLPSSTEVQE